MAVADPESVITTNLQQYIELELAELYGDLDVYNVLPCPRGSIMGDAQEITTQLERSYSASVTEMDLDSMLWLPPSF